MYIITIPRGKKRYNQSIQILAANHFVNVHTFYGIDGKELTREQIDPTTTSLCSMFCTRSMIGCGLSHISLWDHIFNHQDYGDDDIIFILEDDTTIQYDLWIQSIDFIVELLQEPTTGFVQLAGGGFWLKESRVYGTIKANRYQFHTMTGSYAITKRMAGILSTHFWEHKLGYHIDYELSYIFNKWNLKMWLLDPQISIQGGWNNSTITEHESSIFGDGLTYAFTFPICQICGIIITCLLIMVIVMIALAYMFFPYWPILSTSLGLWLYTSMRFD